jgi:HEAT repeat protein
MSSKLNSCLTLLADESRPVRTIDLAELSDLSRSQVAEFQAAWHDLRPNRRLELLTAMVEQAETNIHLIFHAALRACLADDDPRVRRLAIEGLWEDEKVSLVQPLSEMLRRDPAVEVRAAAATSLGRFVLLGVLGEIAEEPARQAEEALRSAWHRSGEPVAVRRRVLESLSYTDTAELHALIGDAYYSDDGLMRQSAIFAMGRSTNSRWNKIVLSELSNRDAAMRFEAAEAAGELVLRAAVQPLIQRLDDTDQDVREAAASALGKIGGPAARRALETLVAGEDERLAEAASEALDELMFNSDRVDDVLLEYSEKAPRQRSRSSRAADDDSAFPEGEEDFDEADQDDDLDDLEWDDGEGDDLDWDDGDEFDDEEGADGDDEEEFDDYEDDGDEDDREFRGSRLDR